MLKRPPKAHSAKPRRLTPIFETVAVAGVVAAAGFALFNNPDTDSPILTTPPPSSPEIAATPTTPPYADPIAQAVAQNAYGRRFVAPSETNYNAIGKIFAGEGRFSGQVVTFADYQTSSGILVSTAAHGLTVQDIEDIVFVLFYVDENGKERSFITTSNPQVWINPSYQASYDAGETSRVGSNDTALLFYPNDVLPDEIKPVEQYVFSYQLPDYNSYKVATSKISTAGYAADLGGDLSADEDCKSDNFPEGGAISTTCVTNIGASGSPLLASDIFNQNYSLGVLSGVTANENGEIDTQDEQFRSIFPGFFHYQLQNIPFLRKDDICAAVIAPNGANLRTYADIGSGINGPTLPFNDEVRVTTLLSNEQIEIGSLNIWIRVEQTQDGRDGYVRADLLQKTPCLENL